MKTKIYLAGAMEFVPDNGAGWREKVATTLDKCGIIYFNPCTDEGAVLKRHGYTNADEFHAGKTRSAKRWTSCMRDIARDDLLQIASSDFLLVYITPGLGGGTVGELTCAKYIFNIPVIAVWHPEATKKDISGWLQACCDKHFDNFKDAITYIKSQKKKR